MSKLKLFGLFKSLHEEFENDLKFSWNCVEIYEDSDDTIITISGHMGGKGALIFINFTKNKKVKVIRLEQSGFQDLIYIRSSQEMFGILKSRLVRIDIKKYEIEHSISKKKSTSYVSSILGQVNNILLMYISQSMKSTFFYNYKENEDTGKCLSGFRSCYCSATYPERGLMLLGGEKVVYVVNTSDIGSASSLESTNRYILNEIHTDANILSVKIFKEKNILCAGDNMGSLMFFRNFDQTGKYEKIITLQNVHSGRGCIYTLLLYTDPYKPGQTYITSSNVFSGTIPHVILPNLETKYYPDYKRYSNNGVEDTNVEGFRKKAGFYHSLKWMCDKQYMISVSSCGTACVWKNLRWKKKDFDIDLKERVEYVINKKFQGFTISSNDKLMSLEFPKILLFL